MAESLQFSADVSTFRIHHILPLDEYQLGRDVYLVLLHANRIPPHLLVAVNGKIFTLGVSGATVDGELEPLLRLIRHRRIETVFVKLGVPPVFTMEQVRDEIRKFTLAYPRVDVGIATCLNPIRDFCGTLYDPSARKANFIYELLPTLRELGAVEHCYHLNMEPWLMNDAYTLRKYSMNDIYEGIRKSIP